MPLTSPSPLKEHACAQWAGQSNCLAAGWHKSWPEKKQKDKTEYHKTKCKMNSNRQEQLLKEGELVIYKKRCAAWNSCTCPPTMKMPTLTILNCPVEATYYTRTCKNGAALTYKLRLGLKNDVARRIMNGNIWEKEALLFQLVKTSHSRWAHKHHHLLALHVDHLALTLRKEQSNQ